MDQSETDIPQQWILDVVAQWESDLVRYARHLVGDVERARDVVQDTFLKLCQQDRGQLDGHLVEWLFTVCRNGRDVLPAVTARKPDVAICDLQIGTMGGMAVTMALLWKIKEVVLHAVFGVSAMEMKSGETK